MPVYVGLFNFTESGLRAIRDSPARTREVVHWLEDQGFEIHGIYYTMGQYDLVCIIESPDEKSQLRAVMALNQQGLFRTTTMEALTVDEFASIVEDLP
ncbi:MAG: GYD domain-containing protein [Thermomicrobiales bacterium]